MGGGVGRVKSGRAIHLWLKGVTGGVVRGGEWGERGGEVRRVTGSRYSL